jgi:hypothetical protein
MSQEQTGRLVALILVLMVLGLFAGRALHLAGVADPEPTQMCNQACQEWHEQRWDDRVDRDR